MEDVQKPGKGAIPMLAAALRRIFGQMERKGTVGTQQAQEADRQSVGLPVGGRFECRHTGRGEGHRRFLAQADRVVAWMGRGADPRPLGILAFHAAQGSEEAECVGPRRHGSGQLV